MEIKPQINTKPNQLEFQNIKKWLIEEEKKFNEGFYCNWNIIEKAFNQDRLVTLHINDYPIGFLVWSEGEIYVEIDILEIEPQQRGKGIGKFFFEQVSTYFKNKGFLAIKLSCAPIESEKFWKKMGFVKFPDRGYSDPDLTYFKALIETVPASKNRQYDNKLELWNVQPHQKEDNQPKWTWNIETNKDKLITAILFPMNHNWNLRWTKNGKIIKDDKVKYFDTTDNRITYSPFLYVEKLNE